MNFKRTCDDKFIWIHDSRCTLNPKVPRCEENDWNRLSLWPDCHGVSQWSTSGLCNEPERACAVTASARAITVCGRVHIIVSGLCVCSSGSCCVCHRHGGRILSAVYLTGNGGLHWQLGNYTASLAVDICARARTHTHKRDRVERQWTATEHRCRLLRCQHLWFSCCWVCWDNYCSCQPTRVNTPSHLTEMTMYMCVRVPVCACVGVWMGVSACVRKSATLWIMFEFGA